MHYKVGPAILVLYSFNGPKSKMYYSETSDKGHFERGQAESTHVYTLYRTSPLKEDNLSSKDKTAGPEGVLIKRFHCSNIGQ